jgi:ribonuclease HI
MLKIYTDGALATSTNTGGLGVVFVKDDKVIRTFNKRFENVTNNKMELAAVIIALQTLIKNDMKEATIVTDSQYVIGCATKGWKRKKNKRLWERYDTLIKELDSKNIIINYEWVRGHNGDKFNEIADELAVAASIEPELKF